MGQKTWGGRFSGATDDRVEAFTESISFDRRLYRHDVRASQAHARMLAEVGLLSADEAGRIVATLDAIAEEIDRIDIVDVAVDVRVCCEWIGEPVGRGDASLTCIDLDVISARNPGTIRTTGAVEENDEQVRVPRRACSTIAFAVVVATRDDRCPLTVRHLADQRLTVDVT